MLAKNLINRNKLDNKAKTDIKTLILCHLYKSILMDILSLNDGPTQKGHQSFLGFAKVF